MILCNDALEFERYQQRLLEDEEFPEQSFDQFDGEWLTIRCSRILRGDSCVTHFSLPRNNKD